MGKVRVWRMLSIPKLIATLENAPQWIDRLSWCPTSNILAFGLGRYVQLWDARNWDDDPYVVNMDAASLTIAWSTNGEYLASGNLDNTITVLEWGYPHPWVMRGFPGKIRQLV